MTCTDYVDFTSRLNSLHQHLDCYRRQSITTSIHVYSIYHVRIDSFLNFHCTCDPSKLLPWTTIYVHIRTHYIYVTVFILQNREKERESNFPFSFSFLWLVIMIKRWWFTACLQRTFQWITARIKLSMQLWLHLCRVHYIDLSYGYMQVVKSARWVLVSS